VNSTDNGIVAYASVLKLSRSDMYTLKIKDVYSIHRVVYGLFEDTRSEDEKLGSVRSGIVYADKGGDFHTRNILMLSDRKPHQTPQFGQVLTRPVHTDFLGHDRYRFEVLVNPTRRTRDSGKIVPVKGRENVAAWFIDRAKQVWGFSVDDEHLEVEQTSVQRFEKVGVQITKGGATLNGLLSVDDRDRFVKSFIHGIGRGRAFGFGLLQVVPV
jgi:CRISPR system Cascade subunit CasE